MDELHYQVICHWQDDTFPRATVKSCAAHLAQEVQELRESIAQGGGVPDRAEIADCFLLLIGVCNAAGMSYRDIKKCIWDKMQVNLERRWGNPDVDGLIKHIPDERKP